MSVIRGASGDPVSFGVRAARFEPSVQQLMGMVFPSVLKVSEDGTTIIAVSADLILWVKDGRIRQTWKR